MENPEILSLPKSRNPKKVWAWLVIAYIQNHIVAGLLDEQLERRNTTQAHGQRSLQTPQTMQWAIRPRESTSNRPTTTTTTASNSMPLTFEKAKSYNKRKL